MITITLFPANHVSNTSLSLSYGPF